MASNIEGPESKRESNNASVKSKEEEELPQPSAAQKKAGLANPIMGKSLGLLGPDSRIRKMLHYILTLQHYPKLIILCILASSI